MRNNHKLNKKLLCVVISFLMFFNSVAITYGKTDVEGEAVKQTIVNKDNEVTDQKEEVTIVCEIEEKRDEYSTTYLNSDGTYTTYFYTAPIRYRDENGDLVDIDTSIKILSEDEKEELNTEYQYSSEKTEVDILLPAEISEKQPVILTYDKYEISLLPINGFSEKEETTSTDKKQLKSAGRSNGRVIKEEIEDVNGKKKKHNNRISYDAFTDEKLKQSSQNAIELEYIPQNEGIKENIVINKNIGIYQFDFYLQLKGFIAEKTDYGAILLLDDKSKEEIGLIPVPFVYDSGDIDSDKVDYEAVHYQLSKTDEGYILSVLVDESYLNASERQYPVIIDPSIEMINSAIVESHVNSKNPSVNYYGSGNNVMAVGYGTPQYISRTYLKFTGMNETLKDKVIIEAKLYAKVNYTNTNSKSKTRLDRVTKSWSAGSLKWNNKPSSEDDTNSGTVAMSSTGKKSWDISKTVQQWANGKYTNYGFCLRTPTESSSSLNYANFYGSRTGTASNRPYVSVTYENPSEITSIIVGKSSVDISGKVEITFKAVPGVERYMIGIIPKDGDVNKVAKQYRIL